MCEERLEGKDEIECAIRIDVSSFHTVSCNEDTSTRIAHSRTELKLGYRNQGGVCGTDTVIVWIDYWGTRFVTRCAAHIPRRTQAWKERDQRSRTNSLCSWQ